MGDTIRRPTAEPVFDPGTTRIPRRHVLMLMGAGTLAAGAGLGALLEACAAAPVTVHLDVDPASLVPGTPVEVPFTMATGGSTVGGSTWLVKRVSGDLTAFDPRCTHAACRYDWSQDGLRFRCACHDGQFALDGSVLAGPPPRPLDRFPVRVTGDAVEIDVPADFAAPRSSLPA